jgi:hypothetical protein
VTGRTPPAGKDSLTVLVYSDDADTRAEVLLSLGRRPHPDLPPLEF